MSLQVLTLKDVRCGIVQLADFGLAKDFCRTLDDAVDSYWRAPSYVPADALCQDSQHPVIASPKLQT